MTDFQLKTEVRHSSYIYFLYENPPPKKKTSSASTHANNYSIFLKDYNGKVLLAGITCNESKRNN